jgi:FAD/FMN-containing dehydrogenase
MGLLNSQKNSFWASAVELKKAFDPNGILAPGRYVPA